MDRRAHVRKASFGFILAFFSQQKEGHKQTVMLYSLFVALRDGGYLAILAVCHIMTQHLLCLFGY